MAEHAEPTHRSRHRSVAVRSRDLKPHAQGERRSGAAAQLAAVHQLLRRGPALQLQPGGGPIPNRTGLPDRLKSGVEALSGLSLDDVRVHRNSSKPAELQALAYTQGSDIHVAPGQEQHLPHEAWHVVQQMQGRVKPTMQMKSGVLVNDDAGLEREADAMGAKTSAFLGRGRNGEVTPVQPKLAGAPVAQRQPVIQRAKAIGDILNFIDQNRKELGPVTGIHTKRLMYWNDLGYFDEGSGRKLDLKNFRKAMDKKIPIETKEVAKSDLPEFMQVRSDFSAKLPTEMGGEKLWFRKKPENAVMQNRRGWISDNVYWKSSKVRYMVHSILGWKGEKAVDEPEPHVTLRNADTQVNIDLDITNPKPKDQERIKGEMEVTRTSFSRGLKGERKPGEIMKADEDSFGFLEGNTVKTWLENLIKAAQTALS
jgi:uncharacterized protein DUF4157